MNNACTKRKDALLEAALTENFDDELNHHLSHCADCAEELKLLRTRRQRLDALLQLIARGEEPSPNLGMRIVASAEAGTERRLPIFRPMWALAGVAIAIMIASVIWTLKPKAGLTDAELNKAQALAQWQAPTDVLLQIPGEDFLNSTPKLGESYFTMPSSKEKNK